MGCPAFVLSPEDRGKRYERVDGGHREEWRTEAKNAHRRTEKKEGNEKV